MTLPDSTLEALKARDLAVTTAAPLSRRSFWRVGGPADGFLVVRDLATLRFLQELCPATGCPLMVLGNGSNLLIGDGGFRGLVIQLAGDLAQIEVVGGEPPLISVGGGTKLVALLSRAAEAGWTGLGAFAGVPGTLGGAVRMNAGSVLGETCDALVDVTVCLPGGALQTLAKAELRMRYRTTELPPGSIVVAARFATTGGDSPAEQAHIATFLEKRKATQPLDLPSCGSTFRNPPGDHAGRLIEAAGLKGFSIGGAQVSPKHANFIVNTGEATAADVLGVIEHVEATVLAQFGVRLEREVHLTGDHHPRG